MSATIAYNHKGLSKELLLQAYERILFPRLVEEKMLILLRQNKVSKWFSGIGQEAIAAGVALALEDKDWILPLHRNLGVFTGRDIPLQKLVAQWQGKDTGFTHGRDRSFHFGTTHWRIVGMISHLGAMLPVANGLALGSLLKGTQEVAVVFSGDGGASEGDFHEALNVAAVWNLPVIFLVENNGYGLSTPSSEQFRCKSFADKAAGYGIQGHSIDGNNLLEVYTTVKKLADGMRNAPAPVILECRTFRMRGHEEASGTKYVPQELFDLWQQKDPVANYEQFLLDKKILTPAAAEATRARMKAEIAAAVTAAFEEPEPVPAPATELGDVYAPAPVFDPAPAADGAPEIRFLEAITQGLRQSMERHPELVLMGQDIAEYGGVFKATDGFVQAFGKGRVRNTPLCESAILGAGLGLSLQGQKSMVEMQFADFVSCGFNQIVNNLAKNHYRWGHSADVVVRMPTGAGTAAGPFHSQSNEAWFAHTPGLKVVYPSDPYTAKGLLCAALADPNPVIYFEHKKLYRSLTGPVPPQWYALPIGRGRIARLGSGLTVVAYGMAVQWALAAAARLPQLDIEVVDLLSLLPWDQELVYASVKKTSRALVLHEDTLTGGFGAEVAASIGQEAFRWLDAPVMRLGSLDTPVPFHADLEAQFLPEARLDAALLELAAW